ncbi:MAG TPA: hypothetical protein VGN14_11995 [Candidatus Elarobacter sp.]
MPLALLRPILGLAVVAMLAVAVADLAHHAVAATAAEAVDYAVRIGVLTLAVTVVYLRGATVEGFALAAFLALTAFFSASLAPPPHIGWWQTAFALVQGALGALQALALIVLMSALGPQTAARGRIARIGAALCLAVAAYQMIGAAIFAKAGVLLPLVDTVVSGGTLGIALALYSIFVFAVAVAQSRGADRRRLAIAGCALLAGELSAYVFVVVRGSGGPVAWEAIGAVSLAVMAAGLGYALLVEHLFDIGFVVNRAVAYAVISAIVVTFFIGVEWAIEHWASAIGRLNGALIEIALAAAVGLSLRPLHAFVDRLVDELLFSQRHRAANALQRFAREAHLIGEPRKLFDDTFWTLRTFARARDCDILLREEDRTFRSVRDGVRRIHEDDVLALRLRSTGEPVLRRAFPGLREVDGDVALPMLVRGMLTGIVLVALPERAEPYSPEELQALGHVARDVAFALVALDAAEAKRLREENAELRARLLIS